MPNRYIHPGQLRPRLLCDVREPLTLSSIKCKSQIFKVVRELQVYKHRVVVTAQGDARKR